ncbi:hypothetical protein F0562_027120 [Nyssa sinensis]|uniref:Thaumatin-like protein n=1 Tax=Nyssa sinensis TaxID=561372 RepID=A0A5J5B6N7_9ASTE|nr:hypothetical protein F0562_027120 [Nyssa sinensis]
MAQLCLLVSLITLTIPRLFITGVLSSATFTMMNKCEHTVWPGILSNAGIAQLSPTGFALQKGESKTITAPSSWGGRFWGRTLCTEDSTGKFTCVTGDCGSGKLECDGRVAVPPATLAEFTLDGAGGLDFYDVSLVDGYNLPMLVVPQGGTGTNCTTTGCLVDLNGACPSELKVSSTDGQNVACKSAVRGHWLKTSTVVEARMIHPPLASPLRTLSCSRTRAHAHIVTLTMMLPARLHVPVPTTSSRSVHHQAPVRNQHRISKIQRPETYHKSTGTMVYEGGLDQSSASTCAHMFRSQIMASAVAILVAIWRLCQIF